MPSLATLCSGNPAHPPLIFLHGFLGCKEDWKEWFSLFEKKFYCVAVDLPGHGDSTYVDNIVETLRKKIQEDFPQKPHCIAYSMGGRIALQMQELFSHLAILSAHVGLNSEKEKQERLKTDTLWAEKFATLPLDTVLQEWYAQPFFSSLASSQKDLFSKRLKNDPKILSATLLQLSLAKQPFSPPQSPFVYFFYGKEDWKYEKLYATFSFSRAIPDAGHALHLENPQECARQIKEVFDANRN